MLMTIADVFLSRIIQLLLRKKAAEELKKEQERKAAERRRIIEQRCGKPKNVDDANEGIYICYTNNTPSPPHSFLIDSISILSIFSHHLMNFTFSTH